MKIFLQRLTATALSLLVLSLPAFAGPLDDYYLAAFGEQPGNALEKAIMLPAMGIVEAAHCGTPLKHELSRDWNKLEPATQKVLAKQLAAPTLSGTERTFTSSGGNFNIHYTRSGGDAPPLLDVNTNGIPDWVETVAATVELNLADYISLGYRQAPTVNSAPYDIYLRDLAASKIYGQTTSTSRLPSTGFANAYASFMEIDNDFLDSIYVNSTGGPYTALQSLRITTSHEYHHAIQYGYNYYFDVWYAEATSNWYEDELHDSVNQIYNYLPSWFDNSILSLDIALGSDPTATGAGYSRWIFNRYLAEQHGTAFVRGVWEKLATLDSPNGRDDIPVVPVLEGILSASPYDTTLSVDFLGLVKRFYTRDWTSHTNDIGLIPTYTAVDTFNSFPVTAGSFGINSTHPSVTLPHYSFAYYKFTPTNNAPATLNITINGTSGIRATAFLKNSSGTIQEFPFTAVNGTTVSIPGFNSSSEVALLVANAVNVDNHAASFSTNGTISGVTEPPDTPASNLTSKSSGGGGAAVAS